MVESIKNVRIFIASPRDVHEERKRVKRVISELDRGFAPENGLRLELIQWQTHAWPGAGEDAQDVINGEIPMPEIFIGILWKRFGLPTRRADSGTAEEFERCYRHWRENGWPQIMFYFSRRPHFPDNEEDLSQFKKVLDFRLKLDEAGVLYWQYSSLDQFEVDLRGHPTRVLLRRGQLERGAPEAAKLKSFIGQIESLRSLINYLTDRLENAFRVTSVAYFDFDNFGQFNEMFGRPAGDEFLTRAGKCLSEIVEGKGALYRVAGDEFVALMINYNSWEAAATAERMRQSIEALEPGGLGVSIGVASTESVGPLAKDLLINARFAMAVAKKNGKNRLVVWEPNLQIQEAGLYFRLAS